MSEEAIIIQNNLMNFSRPEIEWHRADGGLLIASLTAPGINWLLSRGCPRKLILDALRSRMTLHALPPDVADWLFLELM